MSDDELVVAQDGLLARRVGTWAQAKLYYVAAYMDIFTAGMKAKWKRRAYIDLFAGPGNALPPEKLTILCGNRLG
jgi:hypothetical protein